MGLLYDPDTAVSVLTEADPNLARLMARVGPFSLEVRSMLSPFEALMRSIIYQQLSGKAAATIHRRVLALLPAGALCEPEQILALPEEALRGAGVSRAKTAALRDLAEKTRAGIVPPLEALQQMDDDEIVARLTAVRGIGRWTVEMLLIFRLGRPDVLPTGDLGVRKGFMLTYGLAQPPTPGQLQVHGEAWRPYRSVASWYMWRAVDLENGQK